VKQKQKFNILFAFHTAILLSSAAKSDTSLSDIIATSGVIKAFDVSAALTVSGPESYKHNELLDENDN
jgi:hypothetical protein